MTIPVPAAGEFGARLRAARERRGVTLREIASRSKISVRFLEALERDDIKRLPGGIFTRSFVRSYAAEVGLDPDETVREFVARFPVESVTAGTEHADERDYEAISRESWVSGLASRGVIGGALALPLLGLALYFAIAGVGSSPGLEPTAALSSSTPAAKQAGVPGALDSERLSATARPAVAEAAVEAMAPLPVAPPAAVAVAEGGDVADGVEIAATGATLEPGAAATLTFEFSPRTVCWIKITADGVERFVGLMKPGERQVVQSRRVVQVTVGDAGAMSFTINRAPARPLGGSGVVATVRITPANYRSFLTEP